jgi:hypothetical protein
MEQNESLANSQILNEIKEFFQVKIRKIEKRNKYKH